MNTLIAHKLLYPIEITFCDRKPLKGFPWLRRSDCLRKMAYMNDLGILLGGKSSISEAGPILRVFWSRYKVIFPHHQLWKDLEDKGRDPSRCLPILVHGDEGISFKKGGILICSWQSAFGYGCSKRNGLAQEDNEGMPLNFRKSGIQTRVLSIACPKDPRDVRTRTVCQWPC